MFPSITWCATSIPHQTCLDRLLFFFKSVFSEVNIEIFENPITFPNKEALLKYWKSYTLFEQEVQNEFENAITNIFKKEGKFITKKIVMGITAKK